MRSDFQLRQTKTGVAAFTKVFAPVNKQALRQAILRQLHEELARQTSAAELARDEAISEESQPENKWDTHSQEAAYLAEGQARLASEIHATISVYQTITLPEFLPTDAAAIGAVLEVEGPDGRRVCYLLGPRAGGMEIEFDGRRLLVVTPQSPLGRQLVGRRLGETVQTATRGPQGVQRVVGIE
jgi:transcription elongation GreA/GreB family factor